MNGDFSINDLIARNIHAKMELVAAVSATATKEFSLEKALLRMQNDWQGIQFLMVPYKDTGTFIIGGIDDVQVRLQTLRALLLGNLLCTWYIFQSAVLKHCTLMLMLQCIIYRHCLMTTW